MLEDGNSIDVTIIAIFPQVYPITYYSNPSLGEATFLYVASVPEPTSVVTLAIGLLGLAAGQAYRSRQRPDRSKKGGGGVRPKGGRRQT